MLLVLLSCLGALFSLRARSVFLLFFPIRAFLEALCARAFALTRLQMPPREVVLTRQTTRCNRTSLRLQMTWKSSWSARRGKTGRFSNGKRKEGELDGETNHHFGKEKRERHGRDGGEGTFLLREKGNECFKRGKLDEAEKIYTESLNAKETAAVLSNRGWFD